MNEEIQKNSLVNQVYSLIIKRIQNGTIAQGERLKIEELASDFSVSRTPVREAINRLTQAGFVEQSHNSGPRVVNFNDRQKLDILKTNAVLFGGVIDSYKDYAELEGLLGELEKILQGQKEAHLNEEINTFYEKSIAFHIALIESCPNETMKNFALQTQYQINMCALCYQKESAFRERSIAEHSGVLDALKARNFDEAIKRMNQHIKSAVIAIFSHW